MGAQASESAADTQAEAALAASGNVLQATRESNALIEKMYNQGREDTAPWRETGKNALSELYTKVQAGPGEFTADPGYQFRLGEGTKALESSAAAKGNVLGGATLKALTRYNQDYATNNYQNFLANYYQSLTPYQSLAQVGQTTATGDAASGNQVASNIAGNTMAGTNTSNNALMTAANAIAQGTMNQSNAISNSISSGVNNYLLWKNLAATNSGAAAAGASKAYTNNQSAAAFQDAMYT
jgi:hypothetical protein